MTLRSWIRNVLLLFVLTILVMFVASCSTIREGTIVDKQFYDEHTDWIPVYTYGSNGSVTGFYLQEDYTPPCWEFFLRNGDETGSQCVEPRDYMVYQIGQHYTMPED